MIVGRFLGVDALAAVGSTTSLNFLVVGWITGMTSGFGIDVYKRQAFIILIFVSKNKPKCGKINVGGFRYEVIYDSTWTDRME